MSLQTVLMVLSIALAVGAAVVLWVLLRSRSSAAATASVDEGHFRAALDEIEGGSPLSRDQALAGAVAAKHLLELERAESLLVSLTSRDPSDGEAWLERGLVAAYDGRLEEANEHLGLAQATRSDLLESVTLHRAWVALLTGDTKRAIGLFDEIEVPLETKLRQDIGEGDASFAEWFLQAGALWQAKGDDERAAWARQAAVRSAPESRLPDHRVNP